MAKIGRPKNDAARVKAFAENLNEIKFAKGMTNQDICNAMGFKHPSQLTYWTAGHGMPTPSNLKRLADVLDVHITDLTGQKLTN